MWGSVRASLRPIQLLSLVSIQDTYRRVARLVKEIHFNSEKNMNPQNIDWHIKYHSTFGTRIGKSAELKVFAEDTKIVHTHCPLCNQAFFPLVGAFTKTRIPVLTKSVCFNCSFITYTKFPIQSWFEAYYLLKWGQNLGNASIERRSQRFSDTLIQLLTSNFSKDAHVLEIGTGYGGNLNKLKILGWKHLYGLEASEKRQKAVQNKCNLNVALTTTEKMLNDPLITQGMPYDLIYSWHVFEHIYDIAQAMHNIAKIIKPGGHLVIGVPNYLSETLGKMANSLNHIHQFSPFSLSYLLKKYGFEVTYLDAPEKELRIIAKKTEQAGPVVSGMTKRERKDFLQRLHVKFRKELFLDTVLSPKFAQEETTFIVYDGEVLATEALSLEEKMILNLKKQFFVFGVKPIRTSKLHIQNLLDFKNVTKKIATKVLPFQNSELCFSMDCTPTKNANVSSVGDTSYRTLRYIYPYHYIYSHIKG